MDAATLARTSHLRQSAAAALARAETAAEPVVRSALLAAAARWHMEAARLETMEPSRRYDLDAPRYRLPHGPGLLSTQDDGVSAR